MILQLADMLMDVIVTFKTDFAVDWRSQDSMPADLFTGLHNFDRYYRGCRPWLYGGKAAGVKPYAFEERAGNWALELWDRLFRYRSSLPPLFASHIQNLTFPSDVLEQHQRKGWVRLIQRQYTSAAFSGKVFADVRVHEVNILVSGLAITTIIGGCSKRSTVPYPPLDQRYENLEQFFNDARKAYNVLKADINRALKDPNIYPSEIEVRAFQQQSLESLVRKLRSSMGSREIELLCAHRDEAMRLFQKHVLSGI